MSVSPVFIVFETTETGTVIDVTPVATTTLTAACCTRDDLYLSDVCDSLESRGQLTEMPTSVPSVIFPAPLSATVPPFKNMLHNAPVGSNSALAVVASASLTTMVGDASTSGEIVSVSGSRPYSDLSGVTPASSTGPTGPSMGTPLSFHAKVDTEEGLTFVECVK